MAGFNDGGDERLHACVRACSGGSIPRPACHPLLVVSSMLLVCVCDMLMFFNVLFVFEGFCVFACNQEHFYRHTGLHFPVMHFVPFIMALQFSVLLFHSFSFDPTYPRYFSYPNTLPFFG